jgi:hypothetical protein
MDSREYKEDNVKEIFINWLIKILKADTNKISDGYHTYRELYNHKIYLFILLMKYASKLNIPVWYSDTHSDGSQWQGWLIAGIGKEKGKQITYHLNSDCLYEFVAGHERFAEKLTKAPEWDGHTPGQVVERLRQLILYGEIR